MNSPIGAWHEIISALAMKSRGGGPVDLCYLALCETRVLDMLHRWRSYKYCEC